MLHDASKCLRRTQAATRRPPVSIAEVPDVDELDAIESTVRHLTGTVARVRDEGALRERAAIQRAQEYAAITAEVARVMADRLVDAELPLHVLLSSPFGSLNENQEELLGAAQAAVGAADEEVRRLKAVLDLDSGNVKVVPQPVGVRELLKPVISIVEAHAHAARVGFDVQMSESIPRAVVDPIHTQSALTAILDDIVVRSPQGSACKMVVDDVDVGAIRIVITHPAFTRSASPSLALRLAMRVVALQAGSLRDEAHRTVIEFPCEVTHAAH